MKLVALKRHALDDHEVHVNPEFVQAVYERVAPSGEVDSIIVVTGKEAFEVGGTLDEVLVQLGARGGRVTVGSIR